MRIHLLTAILLFPVLSIAQTMNKDTLSLADCKANYPIIGTVSDLQHVPNIRKWHYCYNVKNQRYPLPRISDTIYYYSANQIYGDDFEISYLENNGRIRLEYILLKKHRKFKMNIGARGWSNGLTLKYKTSLEDVMKHFNRDVSNLSLNGGRAPLMIGTRYKTMWHVIPVFYTGEPYDTTISLTFNKHKKLIIIEIDYYEHGYINIGSLFKDSVL